MEGQPKMKRGLERGLQCNEGGKIVLPVSGARPKDFPVALEDRNGHINLSKNYFVRVTRNNTLQIITK